MIEAASVQWKSGQIFGQVSFWITDTQHQRFGQVLRDLIEG
jgi:hypothetical protein